MEGSRDYAKIKRLGDLLRDESDKEHKGTSCFVSLGCVSCSDRGYSGDCFACDNANEDYIIAQAIQNFNNSFSFLFEIANIANSFELLDSVGWAKYFLEENEKLVTHEKELVSLLKKREYKTRIIISREELFAQVGNDRRTLNEPSITTLISIISPFI